jgi:hypothetical protein
MRVGVKVGPFYLSTSTRRRSRIQRGGAANGTAAAGGLVAIYGLVVILLALALVSGVLVGVFFLLAGPVLMIVHGQPHAVRLTAVLYSLYAIAIAVTRVAFVRNRRKKHADAEGTDTG